jgi:prolyl 4-hydroxylase
VYPPQTHRMQPTRFATLLLYLNDDFEGGETRFPRATNANFHNGITIEPKKGTAVLFYSVLPDGNVDDLSQHSGQPVTKGEKVRSKCYWWCLNVFAS